MTKSPQSNRSSRAGKEKSGCGFIFTTGLIILILLFINVWLVRQFGKPLFESFDNRIFQAVQFVFPISMIFFEFWIFDKLFRR